MRTPSLNLEKHRERVNKTLFDAVECIRRFWTLYYVYKTLFTLYRVRNSHTVNIQNVNSKKLAHFLHLRFLTGRGESSENERISWAWRVDLRRGIHCKPTEIELSIAGLMGGCTSVTPQQQISRCRKQHICDNARKAKGHDGGATMRAGSRLQGGGGIDQGIASLGSGGAHRSSAAHAPPPRPLRG